MVSEAFKDNANYQRVLACATRYATDRRRPVDMVLAPDNPPEFAFGYMLREDRKATQRGDPGLVFLHEVQPTCGSPQ